MKMLDGKVALVTGASGGIGSEIAVELARNGADIALHYGGNKEKALATKTLIEDLGGRAEIFQASLAEVTAARRLVGETNSAFGRLDILVNNAGIGFQKQISDVSEEEFDHIFSINSRAYYFCQQEAAKMMAEGGRIINISSALGHSNRPGTSLYAMSRAAVHALTRVASMELGTSGITVNSVSPGPVSPGIFDDQPAPIQEMAKKMTPFGRVGTPNDIAGIVVFLASDQSRWVTGQDISATGGARP